MEGKLPSATLETKPEIKSSTPTLSKGIPAFKSRFGIGNLKQSKSVIGSTGTPRQESSPKTSKIPKSEKSPLLSRTIGQVPPPDKRFSLRKKSKTSIDISSPAVSRQKTSISPRPQTSRPPLTAQTSRTSSVLKPKCPKNSSVATIVSVPHRAGEVPSYLKKGERTVTETALNTKKRALNTQKKKLTEIQSEFLSNYKSLQNLQTKFNKFTGKTDRIDEVKLLAVVDGDTGELLVKDGEKTVKAGMLKKKRALSPSKPNLADIEQIRPKLLLIHEAGFKLCQEFVDNFDKIQSEKEGQEAGDCTNLQKEILRILKTMEEKIVNEESEQKKLLTEVLVELQDAICKKHGDTLGDELVSDGQSNNQKNSEFEISNLSKQLEDHKKKLEISDSKLKELGLCESNAFKALKIQLGDKELLLSEKEHEITKMKTSVKALEDQYRKSEKKSLNVSNDLLAKDGLLKKLENDLEELKKLNKSYENIINEVKRQKEGILDVIRKEQESKKLYEKECETRKKIEAELVEKENIIMKLRDLSKINMVDKETSVFGGGDRSHETKIFNELQTLKVTVERLNKEKSSLEQEKEDMAKTLLSFNREDLKLELAKANQEISHLNTTNSCLRDTIARLEDVISKKVAIINELERKISNGQYLANASKELQNEINSLRESECEKKREIDALKSELSKAHVEIQQQEETICMHQRLLRIRSELINSLQEKEASNRCRMDDLHSEISKKTSLVNQMNHEMSAKAEELQNLFSTLGTKQLEVNRQEHIIKMLEENNERNQRLRVKQEERIARLENENAELKHLLYKYDCELNEESRESHSDKGFTSNQINTKLLPKSSKEEENVSTRDLFDYGRRKKRQKDIEVKKIQK